MKPEKLLNAAGASVCCEISANYSLKVKPSELPEVRSSRDVYNYMIDSEAMKDINYRERMISLYLSRSNRVLGHSLVSLGGIAGTVCDPRLIYQVALLCNATGVILCHNHPSGNHKPSEADIKLTQKIKNAGFLLDINLLDHIVVTDEKYFSFADEGMM